MCLSRITPRKVASFSACTFMPLIVWCMEFGLLSSLLLTYNSCVLFGARIILHFLHQVVTLSLNFCSESLAISSFLPLTHVATSSANCDNRCDPVGCGMS